MSESGFKLKTWHIVVLFLILAFYFGWISIPGLKLWETPPPGPGGPSPEPDNLVSVTRQIKFTFTDKYAGSAGSGTVYVYASDGKTLLESGSISSGAYTTTDSYPSGTVLYVKYDDGSNSILWKKITVPKMNPQDAESITTNPVKIEVFDICSLTDTMQDSSGNSFSDNGNWNKTSGGNPGSSVATATYSVYVGSDNDGFMSSYDPIYGYDLGAWLIVKVSGTNYENVVITGFDYAYEKGTAMYYWYQIPDTGITKWKVGNEYVYSGAWSFSWTVDLSGYSGDAADMQIYVKAYASPLYHQTYGDYGPYDVELAEQTINLVD